MRRRWQFAILLASLVLAAMACQFGDSQSSEGDGAGSDPAILFQDDFSNSSSGWDSIRDESGLTDYENGRYRILVNRPNFDYWANPGLTFTDVSVEVTAVKASGPDENDFGVICRYRDVNNFYFFILGSDGFYGIGKVADGEQQLVGMDEMQFTNSINKGNASNRVRADCVGSSLTLYANDQVLADVSDQDFTSGDVGLIAGTFDEPGTDILFDDFVVRRP